MKRILPIILFVAGTVLTASAYEHVDSLTFYASKDADQPLLDMYGDTVSPGAAYMAVNAEAAEYMVHVGYSGDTIVAMYLPKQDTTALVKIERYQTNEKGQLYKSGLHEYYRNGHCYHAETYRKGAVTAYTWYDAEGYITRRFKTTPYKRNGVELVLTGKDATQAVQQRVELYPQSSKVRMMEIYNKDGIGTHFYDLQSAELPFTPPSLREGNDRLSRQLSKEFRLADKFIMQWFSYNLRGAVMTDGSLRLQSVRQTSTVTSRGTARNTADTLLHTICRYVQALPDRWQPGTVNGEPVSMAVEIPLVYSPIYYAENGDTLFCERVEQEINSASVSASVPNAVMYVRNDRSMPYYAVASRERDTIVLNYYDAANGHPVMVERYTASRPDSVVKAGRHDLLAADGTRISYCYDADTIQLATEYDAEGATVARYTFYQASLRHHHPKVRTKEIIDPSGTLQHKIVYAEFKNAPDRYFDPRGHEEKYVPSGDVQAVLAKVFTKSFKLPGVNDKKVEHINNIKPVVTADVSISEAGEIQTVELKSTRWQYNYQVGKIDEQAISKIINSNYAPYLQEFMDAYNKEIKANNLTCTPAAVSGKPLASKVEVKLEKVCVPKYESGDAALKKAAMKAAQAAQPEGTGEPLRASTNHEGVIFIVVEQMPEFPGGTKALKEFLNENVQYPAVARQSGIQGRVVCSFVVETDGSITAVKVVRSSGASSLDKEALRVLMSMPRWKPGKQRGKPVRVQYTVPVTFSLE